MTPNSHSDDITRDIELDIYVFEFIDEVVRANVDKMHFSKFLQEIADYITDHIYDIWCEIVESDEYDDLIFDDDNEDELADYVQQCIELYFDTMTDIPARSNIYDLERLEAKTVHDPTIYSKIAALQTIEQPKQRTQEWYEFRHGLITASQIGKLFSSDAQYNSLIYEKCKPYDISTGSRAVNTESTLHWGNKYEPLSIMLYERRYNTKIGDFGCIRHPKYPFIGASPDGINIDPLSSKYGCMLEVKNIINRDITGIPLDAYWVQMQMQMETCDLDECDFLETQFKEYEDEDAFYADASGRDKGVILYFIRKTTISNIADDNINAPHYVYMPLNIETTCESVTQWISAKKAELRSEYTLYTPHYWYLDKYSCVLVQRNRHWARHAIPRIEEAWNTIVRERVSGYEHRGAKKNRNHPIVTAAANSTVSSRQIENLHLNRGISIIKLE